MNDFCQNLVWRHLDILHCSEALSQLCIIIWCSFCGFFLLLKISILSLFCTHSNNFCAFSLLKQMWCYNLPVKTKLWIPSNFFTLLCTDKLGGWKSKRFSYSQWDHSNFKGCKCHAKKLDVITIAWISIFQLEIRSQWTMRIFCCACTHVLFAFRCLLMNGKLFIYFMLWPNLLSLLYLTC